MMEEQEQALDVRQYLDIIYRRRYLFMIIAAVIVTFATVASYLRPNIYEASTIVSIERNYINVLMRDLAVESSTNERVQALAVVMTSRRTLLRVLEELQVPMSKMTEEQISKLITHYQNNTKIKQGTGRAGRTDADIFTVSYQDRDPRFARDYVNALVSFYVIESLSAKREEALGANRFIYDQMELYKGKLARTEAALATRKKQLSMDAISRLVDLQNKLDEMLVQYTEDHPDVLRLKGEIASTKEQIRRSTGGTGDTPSGQGARALMEAGNDKSVKDLERERDAYLKVYESLVASLGRSEVSAQVEVKAKADTFNILEPATLPIKPVSRPRWKFILMGLIAGVIGAAAAVILIDRTDRTIKSVDTLRNLGLPVIGIIPRISSPDAISAARRKDLLAYGLAGVYLASIGVIVVVEYMR